MDPDRAFEISSATKLQLQLRVRTRSFLGDLKIIFHHPAHCRLLVLPNSRTFRGCNREWASVN